ncbi:hypothetical protein ACOME3_004111 [Neoechinorhynchus agilis]
MDRQTSVNAFSNCLKLIANEDVASKAQSNYLFPCYNTRDTKEMVGNFLGSFIKEIGEGNEISILLRAIQLEIKEILNNRAKEQRSYIARAERMSSRVRDVAFFKKKFDDIRRIFTILEIDKVQRKLADDLHTENNDGDQTQYSLKEEVMRLEDEYNGQLCRLDELSSRLQEEPVLGLDVVFRDIDGLFDDEEIVTPIIEPQSHEDASVEIVNQRGV